jgi:hypothetical protein
MQRYNRREVGCHLLSFSISKKSEKPHLTIRHSASYKRWFLFQNLTATDRAGLHSTSTDAQKHRRNIGTFMKAMHPAKSNFQKIHSQLVNCVMMVKSFQHIHQWSYSKNNFIYIYSFQVPPPMYSQKNNWLPDSTDWIINLSSIVKLRDTWHVTTKK